MNHAAHATSVFKKPRIFATSRILENFRKFSKVFDVFVITVLVGLSASCTHIDDKRLPPAAVYVAFSNVGEWHQYGISGATDYRYFVKADRVPDGFPYTAMSYTGFGGILLIGDINGNPIAYDLACPVECKSSVRVRVNSDYKAECPVCHSLYDVITNYGQPLAGPAAQHHYGLQKYYVGPGYNGEYIVVTR